MSSMFPQEPENQNPLSADGFQPPPPPPGFVPVVPTGYYGAPMGGYGTPANIGWSAVAIVALVAVFVFPLAGLILGIVALSSIKKNGQQGKGLAITAIVLGAVFTLISVAFFFLIFAIGSSAKANADRVTAAISADATMNDVLTTAVEYQAAGVVSPGTYEGNATIADQSWDIPTGYSVTIYPDSTSVCVDHLTQYGRGYEAYGVGVSSSANPSVSTGVGSCPQHL